MNVRPFLRTVDLAHTAGVSVQQVRNYEAGGFLPPAERAANGYRLYTQRHLSALKAAVALISSYGLQRARSIMQAVHAEKLAVALALIDERHSELANQRLQLEQTLAALRTLAVQPGPLANTRYSQRLRVGEAAKQAGVRISALHFWEQQGLLHPTRDKSSRYRIYDEQQMQRLQVVVLLRAAGYDFDVIRATLNELTAGQPAKAIAAIEKRHIELARMSWACVIAMPAFQAYVSEFWENLLT